jgi:hypothetical protein
MEEMKKNNFFYILKRFLNKKNTFPLKVYNNQKIN